MIGMNRDEQERYERLVAEIKDADAATIAAEKAISEYCQTHANAHAMQLNRNGFVVRLNAMTADPALSILEAERDEAKKRFARVQDEFASLKEKINPEVHYIGGKRQS
jgi:hypothetical protein